MTYLFGYGTSASAPYVSGIAALLLAQTPTLTATQLRSRIEQFATRPAGTTRSDTYGWGIVNAYNALIKQNGPPRVTYVRLLDVGTGNVVKSMAVNSAGGFSFTRVPNGTYYLQAGDDEVLYVVAADNDDEILDVVAAGPSVTFRLLQLPRLHVRSQSGMFAMTMVFGIGATLATKFGRREAWFDLASTP